MKLGPAAGISPGRHGFVTGPSHLCGVNSALTLPQPKSGAASGPAPVSAQGGLTSPRFPADLRAWESTEALVHRVLEAVNGQPAGPELYFAAGEKRRNVRQILATLAYAYAIGLYGSEDIEEQQRIEPGLRYLSTGLDLDSPTIRRFRRAHRGPLSVVLLWLLRSCLAAREGSGQPAVAPVARPTPTAALAGLDPWMEFCAAEAEARLTRAVFTDSMAMDL